MRVPALVLISPALALLLWPQDSSACSAVTEPPRPVRPAQSALEVPRNTRVHLTAGPGIPAEAAAFVFVKLDSDGGTAVPFDLERLPFASQLEGRIQLTPAQLLDADSTYAVCHYLDGAPDGGPATCPPAARVVTFTTGADELTTTPTSAMGVVFDVSEQDFPDAGPNLYCGPPQRVRGVDVIVPDGGGDLLYFARAGDAGIFSAEPGAWLPSGIHTVDATAAGILDCDGRGQHPFASSWGLPAGTTELSVWTEDVAGNASAPLVIPLQGDCGPPPQSPDAGAAADSGDGDPGPAQGCSIQPLRSTASTTLVGLGALLLLWTRRRPAHARPAPTRRPSRG